MLRNWYITSHILPPSILLLSGLSTFSRRNILLNFFSLTYPLFGAPTILRTCSAQLVFSTSILNQCTLLFLIILRVYCNCSIPYLLQFALCVSCLMYPPIIAESSVQVYHSTWDNVPLQDLAQKINTEAGSLNTTLKPHFQAIYNQGDVMFGPLTYTLICIAVSSSL